MTRRLRHPAMIIIPLAVMTFLLGVSAAGGADYLAVGPYGYAPTPPMPDPAPEPFVWGSVHVSPEAGVCPGQSVTIYGDGALPGSEVRLGLWASAPQDEATATGAGAQAGAAVVAQCGSAPEEDDVTMYFGSTTADSAGKWTFTGTVPATATTQEGASIAPYPGRWTITTNLPSGVSSGINGSLTVLDCDVRGIRLPETGARPFTGLAAAGALAFAVAATGMFLSVRPDRRSGQ